MPGCWEDFRRFDRANPEIWRLFKRFTFDKIRDGFRHYGARDVIHRIRWETAVVEKSDSGLKINNDWSPYYARKFHETFPHYDGFFRLRGSRADNDYDDL